MKEIKLGSFRFRYENGAYDCLWNLQRKTEKKGKGRILWLKFSNKKFGENIWGVGNCQAKSHFCLQIPKVITLDTAHVGKRLWGRLNLTRLFNKDYHVYGSGDVQSSC